MKNMSKYINKRSVLFGVAGGVGGYILYYTCLVFGGT